MALWGALSSGADCAEGTCCGRLVITAGCTREDVTEHGTALVLLNPSSYSFFFLFQLLKIIYSL